MKSLNLNQIKINVCISIEFRKTKKQIWNNWNKVYKNYSILVTIFALQSENDIISEIKCWFADLIQFFLSNLKKKKEWCYSVMWKKRHKFTVNTSRRIISLSSNGINHHRSPGLSLKCEEYMGMLSSRLKFSGSKGREPYITLTTRGWIQAGDLPQKKWDLTRTAQVTVNTVQN